MHTAIKMQKNRCSNRYAALEIYGEWLGIVKNTMMKNMYLRHHSTVNLEINSLNLNGCQDT